MSWMLDNLIDGLADQLRNQEDAAGEVMLPSSDNPARWSIDESRSAGLLVWDPGNGTRYRLLFQPVYGKEFCREIGGGGGRSVFVTHVVPGRAGRTYPFNVGGYFASSYVHEKLGGFEDDAKCLAIMLAEVLDGSCEPRGTMTDNGGGCK